MSSFGREPPRRSSRSAPSLGAFALGSDLLTMHADEPPKPVAARAAPSASSKFLPRSGRRMIRDTLISLIEHVRTSLQHDGLELVIDVADEQAEQQLWRKDDAAWYWLAAGGPNTQHTSENDVLKMHSATLRRIVDPDSLRVVEEQIELSKLAPDPDRHVPLERWVASRPKEDIVWEYLQSTLRLTLRMPPSATVSDDRMRMELNSVTLYVYLVTMNPSAYGTHVRTLMQGAFQYALHHLLVAKRLGRSAEEYVRTFIAPRHQSLVSGVLSSAEVGRCLEAMLDAMDDNRDQGAAKLALIHALDKTPFIQTVTSMLQRNTVHVDRRDPNFAYVFGLYKTLALIRCMCRWVAMSSRHGGSKASSIVKYTELVGLVDRVDGETRRELSHVGQDEGSPLGEVSQRASSKLLRDLRAAADILAKLGGYTLGPSASYTERVYLVRLLSEALYAIGLYYARLHFASSITNAARPVGNQSSAVLTAKFAIKYRASLERFESVKHLLSAEVDAVSRLLGGSSPRAEDISGVLRGILRLRMLGGLERRLFQNVHAAPGTALSVLKTTPLVETPVAWTAANNALWDWHAKASERAATLGYDPSRGSTLRIDLSKFGESRFGAHGESRTESTIGFIDLFFLTGLYRTLDELDGKVGGIIFDTGRDTDGRLVATPRQRRHSLFGDERDAAADRERLERRSVRVDYRTKISELRTELVLLLEIMRNGAQLGVSTALNGEATRSKPEQAYLVRNACHALTHVLKRALSQSTVGLVFSVCSNMRGPDDDAKLGGQRELPLGATTRLSEEEGLEDQSGQSRTLAASLAGPKPRKLFSFAARAPFTGIPDFHPTNDYVWST